MAASHFHLWLQGALRPHNTAALSAVAINSSRYPVIVTLFLHGFLKFAHTSVEGSFVKCSQTHWFWLFLFWFFNYFLSAVPERLHQADIAC